MADKEEETTEEESPKEKKSGNMLMIIIIVVLILIIVLGAVAFLLLSGDDEEAVESTTPKKEKVKKIKRTSTYNSDEDVRPLDEIGILYPLDTFTVNLKSDSGRRFLKTSITLELDGEELSMELDAKAAVLRDRIIRILSSKTLEEVSSKKGKNKLAQQIMDTLNAMITDGQIKGIYFTEFVIQ